MPRTEEVHAYLQQHETFCENEPASLPNIAVLLDDLPEKLTRKYLVKWGFEFMIKDWVALNPGYAADITGRETKYLVLYTAVSPVQLTRCYFCGNKGQYQAEISCRNIGCDGRYEPCLVPQGSLGVHYEEGLLSGSDIQRLGVIVREFDLLGQDCKHRALAAKDGPRREAEWAALEAKARNP